MSYSISTLLTRNLYDVFGENDPARRRAAIDEIFTEELSFQQIIILRDRFLRAPPKFFRGWAESAFCSGDAD